MDLVELFRTLRRRWILTLPLLALTFVMVAEANAKIPGPFQAESMVVLLPSVQSSAVNGNNPYLSFQGSLNIAGDIVAREVMDPRTVANLAASGYPSSYQIADDATTSGPVLDITVTGKNKEQVESTLQAVTSTVQNRLTSLQQAIKTKNRITSMVISMAPTAKLEVSKKARVLVLVLGLGLVLTVCIPLLVDAEITRFRRRRNMVRRPIRGGLANPWRRPQAPEKADTLAQPAAANSSLSWAGVGRASGQPKPERGAEPARPDDRPAPAAAGQSQSAAQPVNSGWPSAPRANPLDDTWPPAPKAATQEVAFGPPGPAKDESLAGDRDSTNTRA
jgi:hypothetical protein